MRTSLQMRIALMTAMDMAKAMNRITLSSPMSYHISWYNRLKHRGPQGPL